MSTFHFFPSLSFIYCSYTYDLDCFNGHGSLPSGWYPSLDDVDCTSEVRSDFNPNLEDTEMHTLHVPRPQLRSQPPINFYGKNSATPLLTMSGSTLHSNMFTFPPKVINPPPLAFSPEVIDPPQQLPPSVIITLTITKLCFNPHYCELCEQYDYVSTVLALHMDKEAPSKRNVPVQDNCQCAYFLFLMSRHALNETAPALHADFHKSHTSKLAVEFHNADSHAPLSLEFNNADSHKTLSLG